MVNLRVPQNTRQVFGISWIFTDLTAGTYKVGMCGTSITNAGSWNSNDYGYVTATVFGA